MLESIDEQEKMDEREIYWIKEYNSTNKDIGYNLSEGGKVNRAMKGENNPFYGKKHSDETKQKLKLAHANRTYRKHTEEEKQKMRDIMTGRQCAWGYKLSENAKANPNYGMRGKKVRQETKEKLSTSAH